MNTQSHGATDQIFEWLASQVLHRQPAESVPLVVLMDGQFSLWQAAQTYLPQTHYIEILDLLHVTSRVWSVVSLWANSQSDEAIRIVKAYVALILQGKVKDVIAVWRLLADSGDFKAKQRKDLEKVCQYFENNQHRMRYDQYLAAGYPIASGVIEALVVTLSKTGWKGRVCSGLSREHKPCWIFAVWCSMMTGVNSINSGFSGRLNVFTPTETTLAQSIGRFWLKLPSETDYTRTIQAFDLSLSVSLQRLAVCPDYRGG